jgi:hypothetical protein
VSKFQHNRDGILTPEERANSSRKCLKLLAEVDLELMTDAERTFFLSSQQLNHAPSYAPSEPQLQWLRDLVERYVT